MCVKNAFILCVGQPASPSLHTAVLGQADTMTYTQWAVEMSVGFLLRAYIYIYDPQTLK